jgi:hypothetical protein
MFSLRSKILIALDAASVYGARIAPGLRGREVRAVARRELASGALVPAALENNVRRPEEVREVLRALVSELDAAGRSAVVVLPDGVARTLIVDLPAGADAWEYAKFRLSSQLPYPAAEAIVEVTPTGKQRVLAAGIRRDIVVEYEKVVAASGLTLDRLDLAPMSALAWLRRHRGVEPRVEVVLGEAVYSMALVGQGTTLAVRTRRRDPGPDEPERLALEVDRTAQLGALTPAGVRVVGPGARRLAEAWTARGVRVEAGWGEVPRIDPREASELAWLGAAFD